MDAHVLRALLVNAQEPLTAILGYAELALDCTSSPDEVRACMESIRSNGHRMYALLAGAMAIADLDESEVAPDLALWSPTELCRDAVAEVCELTDSRAVSAVLECEPGVVSTILTDPLRLRRLVLVLLQRSICLSRGATIRVRIAPRTGCPCGQGECTAISISPDDASHGKPGHDIIGDNLAVALAESLGARLDLSHGGSRCGSLLWLCNEGCEVQRICEENAWLVNGGGREAA